MTLTEWFNLDPAGQEKFLREHPSTKKLVGESNLQTGQIGPLLDEIARERIVSVVGDSLGGWRCRISGRARLLTADVVVDSPSIYFAVATAFLLWKGLVVARKRPAPRRRVSAQTTPHSS